MPRYVRNQLILAKVETTAGTDASPTGGADAVLLAEPPTITPLEATNVNRDLIRGYFGGSEQLVATAFKRLEMTVELAGSGTAATAPQWGDLLLGCAFAESLLSTPNRVEYTPISTSLKTLTIYAYDDGVLHKYLNCMGSVQLMAKVGDRPKLKFNFIGVDGGETAASASGTFTAWKTPVTMTKANVVDITLGGTYATGALSGGTAYKSTGIEMDMANAVAFVPLLSYESVDITDRQPVGTVQFDLTAAEEVSLMTSVKANTTQALGLQIGTVAGNKIILFLGKIQLINPTKAELSGRRLIGYQVRVLPNAGNDEITLVTQ